MSPRSNVARRRAILRAALTCVAALALPSIGARPARAQTQARPAPWPQPGQTVAQTDTFSEAHTIGYGSVEAAFGDTTFTYLIPIGDTTSSPYTRFNSWDIPSPNDSLPPNGPSNDRFTPSRYPLTACPVPFPLNPEVDCRTGGELDGKTYGALRLGLDFTPGVTLSLDTVRYEGTVELTYPVQGSFGPGDTIWIGADARLEPQATLAASARFDSATLALTPVLRPFSARLRMRVCVLGACDWRVRDVSGPLRGDPLVVTRTFDGTTLASRGLTGSVRLPRIALTETSVVDGHKITVAGEDAYASLDWDLDRFLCDGCLAGTSSILGASVAYTLLALDLHTGLRLRTEISVEPSIDVTLDFDEREMEYLVTEPDGSLVDSGEASVITFGLGNSVGLVMGADSAGTADPIVASVSMAADLPQVDYKFQFISEPFRRDLMALRARYTIPPTVAGPVVFLGDSFTLGPASDTRIVTGDVTIHEFEGAYRIDADPYVYDIPPMQLTPERPEVTTTAGAATPSPAVPVSGAGPQTVPGAPGTLGSALSQAITVRNTGNVHLADIGVGYALRAAASGDLVEAGEVVPAPYLEMLEPMDVRVPLDLESGKEYRLGVTVRAATPIGTGTVTEDEFTIGMYEVELGTADEGGGESHLPVTVFSSAELDVRRLDPASVDLAGVPATAWDWDTVDHVEVLLLRFPLEEVYVAARGSSTEPAPTLVWAELVQTLLDDGRSLTSALIDLADRQGNGNGELDVGDVRAYLEATGNLPVGRLPSQADPASTNPVSLLLSGRMDEDQRAYGMDVLLLSQEGS